MRYLLPISAILCALLFFFNVHHLWPSGHAEILRSQSELEAAVKPVLAEYDIDSSRYEGASRLRVDDKGLSYIESVVDQDHSTQLIADGLPLFYYRLSYKKAMEPVTLTCAVHPDGRLLGWDEDWPRDHAAVEETSVTDAKPFTRERALIDATKCIVKTFQLGSLELIEEQKRSYPKREEFSFVFKHVHQVDPLIEEEISIIISGSHIRKAWRSISVPAAAERQLHSAAAPASFLATIGFGLFSIAAIGAVLLVLLTLNKQIKLRIIPCLWIVAALSIMLLINTCLQHAMLFEAWDPLWPAFISYAKLLLFEVLYNLIPLVPLFAFLVMAQHYDDQSENGRMRSMWLCLKGNFKNASVRASSWRGFAIGFLAGAALVVSVLLCHFIFGGSSALQPRGFFFYTINSSVPILTCLCFFGYIAFLEEGAYRLFGGAFLEQRFKSRAIAIIIPGIIYGLCHAEFAFLPPAEPWWARAACLTLVGCVWGWAFFRYDALTVILSHFAADLFIFNWPLIAHGDTIARIMAILSVSLPLWPFIIGSILIKVKNEQPPKTITASE